MYVWKFEKVDGFISYKVIKILRKHNDKKTDKKDRYLS